MTRNVYVAIMMAAKRGKGLRLTADECFALSAIETAATNATHPPTPTGPDGQLQDQAMSIDMPWKK